MSSKFDQEYKDFKLKCEDFIENRQFREQYKENLLIKEDMDKIKDIDLEELEKVDPKFAAIHRESIKTINKIIKLQEELLAFFEMPKDHMERKYKTIEKADKYVRSVLVKISDNSAHLDSLNEQSKVLIDELGIMSQIEEQQKNMSI
jgi:hypothetical protein